MNGFILINKPPGITSFDVVKKIKSITGENKVGHMGTLDPRACGLLIIGIGKYVRLEEYILKYPKTYIVEILFGIASDSYDRESYKFYYDKSKKKVKFEDLEKALKSFIGEIEQIPPLYSAIHIDGKRAYELARIGKNIELPRRKVYIYKAEIIDFNAQKNTALVEFEVSSGTYIRSLIRDLGERLNIYALTSFLVRTRIGHLSVNESIPFSKIDQNWQDFLLPPTKILDFPIIKVGKEQERKILNGNSIFITPLSQNLKEYVTILNLDDKFIAIGKVRENIVKPEKVFL